jgi:outer membrane protein assembly factor BamB
MPDRTGTVRSIAALAAFFCIAADWPNWRGPHYDGISPETGVPAKWDAPPKIVWEQKIGSAFSAISCVGDKVYTCGTQDKHQVLFCFDADSGKILWQNPIEKEYRERQGGDGTRSTPTVGDGRVYIQGALGRLVCFDAADGHEIWSHKFNAMPQWGYAGSILIEGDLAIANGGDKSGPLVALNRKTGEPVWKCGDPPPGYSTPYPFVLDGQRYVAGLLGKTMVVADPQTGRLAWSMPWETSYDVNASTPLFHDGALFFSSGYKHGATRVKLVRDGEKITGTPLWTNKNIQAKFQSPVLYQGHLYASDDVGLKCVEWTTGKLKWSERGDKFVNGTIVLNGDNLFILTHAGLLLTAKATPEGFRPISQAQILDGLCWTVPTLYRGRLYARNLERIICLNLTP